MNKKHIIKVLCISVVLICMSFVAQAQVNRTAYFLKGYSYNYRMNPAFQPDRGYFSFPLLGNTSISLATNLGISDFIYPKGDELVTFMHPDVKADEFLSNLNKNNNLNFNLDMTLFSLGFYAFGGYNTLDIGLHANMGLNIPKDMFRFMKDMGAKKYILDNIGLRSRNYVDVAIGHSHKIDESLTIGARLKFLAGAAYADMLMDRMELSLNEKQWQINAKGNASLGCMGLGFTYDEDGMVNGVDGFTPGLSGMGIGADLGATYDFSKALVKGLILSASVNDINYIKWKNVSRVGISPDDPYTFNGFREVTVNGEEGGNSLESQFETIANDLGDFFALENAGVSDYSDFFGATMNVGIEYKMPFYQRLSVGALFTHRFDNMFSYTSGSLMLNFSPLNFFDLAASASISSYGYDWGAIVNIHCPGFNVFAAANIYAGKVSKEYIPLESMNASVMFGLNFPFGKRR